MLNLAVIGAGLVGKCHVAAIEAVQGARLACIVDPDDAAQGFAQARGVPCYPSIDGMLVGEHIDGAVLATPSQMHLDGALACIRNNCPVLVEKPLAVNISDAEQIVAAAKHAEIPVLTGHHRRHGAILKKVKLLIDEGALGTITSVQATCWFYKPDDYFDVAWRSQQGGGPVFINTIHDIDTLRYLFGEVASVSALNSSNIRGGGVEDSAAILLRFQNGILATITVSDATVAPWSWELTSGENPGFPATSQACYLIGGTKGSLSVPDMMLWHYRGEKSWSNRLEAQKITVGKLDPLVAQIQQFVAVIRGNEVPLVSGRDGLQSLRVVDAIARSAKDGVTVALKT